MKTKLRIGRVLGLSALMALSVAMMPMTASTVFAKERTSMGTEKTETLVELGRTEQVFFNSFPVLEGVPFDGKIDTGADTTSIHAENIHVSSSHPDYQDLQDQKLLEKVVAELKQHGGQWNNAEHFTPYQLTVSFDVVHPITGKYMSMTDDLEEVSMIRSRTSLNPILRPVINLPMTIADKTVETRINLTDRSRFSTPILVGKSYLDEDVWVLAGEDYLHIQPKIERRKESEIMVAGVTYSAEEVENGSSRTSVHAKNIKIDEDDRSVSFVIESGKQEHDMTLPLVNILKTSEGERPVVNLPVTLEDGREVHWLVYLKDRSDLDTDIGIGGTVMKQYYQDNSEADKPLVHAGHVEIAKALGFEFPVKLDTGADITSINAQDIEFFEKDGVEMVRFTYRNDLNMEKRIETEVVDKVKITARKGEKAKAPRPVVNMEITLGDITETVRVNLKDRDRFHYSMILGKNFLKHGVAVRSDKDFVATPKPDYEK